MKQLFLVSLLAAMPLAYGQVLYDNGPMSTGPVHHLGHVAPAGTTWSEIQSNASGTNGTLGYGLNYTLSTGTGSNHQADDFTVGPEGWTITGFVVYGFRTNAALTEQFSTGVLQIWNGAPGTAGASVIAGDLTTNIIGSTSFTNVYRTGRSAPSPNRPIMAVQLNFATPITLSQGTYWMDYGLTGASTIFAPTVTRVGEIEPAGANARFFTSGQWWTMTDSNSLAKMEVPFQVIGAPVPEPATLAALGLGGLALLRRKRASKA